MDSKRVYLGLDVGTQRIGVALGDSIGRIAQPLATIATQSAATDLPPIFADSQVTDVIVGRPRNQSGATTAQTRAVEMFVNQVLQPLNVPIHWQDESVTSVIAEERLVSRRKPYTKADIDAEAASIILQDFLDQV